MPTVTYRFVSSDQNSVVDAFKSVASAARASAVAARASGTATAAGSAVSSRALQQEAAIAKKLVALRVAASKSALDESRAAGAAFDKKLRDQEKAAAAFERNLKKEVAAFEREERRKADIAQRESTRRERAEQRAAEKISQYQLQTLGRVAGRVGGAVASFGMNLAGRATDLVGSSVRESLQLSELSNRVSINARAGGAEAVNPQALQREFENVAIGTPGVKATEVAQAAQAYVDLTGDLQTARENMASFATVASATGANIQDVATAAASLGAKFDVKNVKDMQQVMASLAFQGKGGAVTMADLAGQFQKLAAAAAAFDIGKGPEAVATLGGLVQIARTGTKSPQQAGTAVENIFSALTTKSGLLAKEGVHVYDSSGKRRAIGDVLAETISQVGGSDLEKKNSTLAGIFGKQGLRAINPLIAAYTNAASGKSGAEAQAAGYDAVTAALKKATETTSSWSELQKDAAQAQDNSSAKVTQAMEMLQAKVAENVVPALLPLIEKLPRVVDAVDPLITILGAFFDAVGDVVQFLETAGLIKVSPDAKKARAQRDLDKFNNEMSNRIGPMSPEELRKKEALEYQVKALGEAAKEPGAEAASNAKLEVEAAAGGAAVGGAVGGAPGAALGAGLGYGTAIASEEQARQAVSLRQSGLIETASGGFISTDGKSAQEAAGKPEIKTDEANKALAGLADTIQAAISKINSAQQPSLGSI